MGRQYEAAGLKEVVSGTRAPLLLCWGEHRRRGEPPGGERGCTVSCARDGGYQAMR